MFLNVSLIFLTFSSIFAKINLNPLEEDTTYPIGGRVCAYGDMNKDQYTDIIVYDGSSKMLTIMEQSKTDLKFNESPNLGKIRLNNSPGWVYCVVADFNGDARPDIMVTTDASTGNGHQTTIYVQHEESATRGNFYPVALNVTFMEQPSVMDVNGDGIGDVVGFDRSGSFVCSEGKEESSLSFGNCTHLFDAYTGENGKRKTYQGFAPIFTDITGDLSAEIIFGINDNGNLKLEVFKLSDIHSEIKWVLDENLTEKMKLPTTTSTLSFQHLGSAVVADFDADGAIEILIPVCSDGCRKVGTILMWTRNRGWVHFQLDLKEFDIFEYDSNRNDFLFRVGDFSLDGYPDLIVTTVSGNNRVTPMILENVEYPDNANFSRKFELKSSSRFVMPAEMSQGTVQMSAFFDLKEDGNLDILVEYKHDGVLKFDFIKCDDKGDTTFLKVQIFTNICSDCRKAIGEAGTQKGSGISWHGACASFRTTDPSDNYRLSSQCQIPQTSHRALYSPYVLFGLGRSPNFIEELKFGTPRQVDIYGTQHHQILQIVPNSRIIAIPPKGHDTYWQIRLYLTASSLIIQSLFVLMTVCGLLILVVIILHMREKHADKKERQAQSHRFHFDAM